MAIIIILLSMIHLCFYFKNSHNRLTVNEIPFHSLTRGLVQIKDSNQVNIGEYHSTATNYHLLSSALLVSRYIMQQPQPPPRISVSVQDIICRINVFKTFRSTRYMWTMINSWR